MGRCGEGMPRCVVRAGAERREQRERGARRLGLSQRGKRALEKEGLRGCM